MNISIRPSKLMSSIVAVFLTTLAASSAAAVDVPVTMCGETVKDGFLTADLDCSAGSSTGVTLRPGGTLDLRGHTLTAPPSEDGVECLGGCEVMSSTGVGVLLGGDHGIYVNHKLAVTVKASGIVISGAEDGIYALGGSVQLRDVTIENSTNYWVWSGRKLRARDSIFSGSGYGFNGGFAGLPKSAGSAKLLNVQVRGTADSQVSFRKLTIVDSVVENGGAEGVVARAKLKVVRTRITGHPDIGVSNPGRTRIVDSEISSNGQGVSTGILSLANSLVMDNALSGIDANRTSVRRSTLTGNALAPSCGVTTACADVVSDDQPKIDKNSICDTSHMQNSGLPGESWGICALD